jgi:hypothetical protein
VNLFILVSLYDFCVLPEQLCYIIRKVDNHALIADRCAPWKISSGVENHVL